MKNDKSHNLVSIFWESTLRCNAYCEFCGSRCGDYSVNQLNEELSADIIRKCFKEISSAYTPENIMVNVTGGEPLLRHDLFEIMKFVSDLGFPWGMVTNGSLINKTVVDKMQATGMRTISISLDGLATTHNEIRKISNGFDKIREAVSLMKKACFLDELQITTVVNHKNIQELEELYLILREWQIDSWRLATVDPIGRAENQKGLLLTEADYQAYLSFFDKHQFDGEITMMTSCSHFLGTYDNLYRNHDFSCETGVHIASILANGDIYVCPNVPRIPELIQGNIKNDSFPYVWEHGFGWFRNPDRQKSVQCNNCEYYESCRGDSLHTWDFHLQAPKVCYKEHNYDLMTDDSFLEECIRNKLLSHYPNMKGIRISYGNSSNAKILFTPRASKQLLTYFEWGEQSARNCFELLAGLAGFKTGDIIVVEYIVPGNLEHRSETTAAFSYDNYCDLKKEIVVLNKGRTYSHSKYKLSDVYSLVGIAHSHPLELDTALSIPDIELHGKMRNDFDAFISLLLNPQKKQIASYYNSVFNPVDLELLMEDGLEVNKF